MITLEKYKDKIDAYFENTPPSEIIKRFEALGYEFEPIDTDAEVDDSPLEKVNQQVVNGQHTENQSTTELKKELHQIIDRLQDEDVLECVYKVVQTFQMKTSL